MNNARSWFGAILVTFGLVTSALAGPNYRIEERDKYAGNVVVARMVVLIAYDDDWLGLGNDDYITFRVKRLRNGTWGE